MEAEDDWKVRSKQDLYNAQLAHLVYALIRRVDGMLAKTTLPDLGPDSFFHKDPTEATVAVQAMTEQDRKEEASRMMRLTVAAITGDPSVAGVDGPPAVRTPAPGRPGMFLVG